MILIDEVTTDLLRLKHHDHVVFGLYGLLELFLSRLIVKLIQLFCLDYHLFTAFYRANIKLLSHYYLGKIFLIVVLILTSIFLSPLTICFHMTLLVWLVQIQLCCQDVRWFLLRLSLLLPLNGKTAVVV